MLPVHHAVSNSVSSTFVPFCSGILLQYCWRSTAEFTPTLPQQMQQDLQGPLSAFSWLTNPTTPFAMHHRFLPPVPQGCQNLLARFNWALPLTHPTPAVEGAAGGDDTPEAIIHEHFVLANAINWFGNAQGFQIIFSALQHPDRCGLTGIHTLLLVLQHSVGHFFKQETRQLVLQPLNAILDYIQHGLAAAEGFAAFEEGDQAYAILLQILTTCRWLAAAVPGGEAASERVTPLQREIVLRLLSSGNFNRQLAGVKELNNLLRLSSLADDAAAQEEGTIEETLAAGGGIESDGDASGPQPGPSMALILGWMREKQVARLMLQSNLHQAQYAEAAQRVLSIMLRYNSLPQDQLEFLWRFTEDASTFEDIKVNVYGMLGMLGPYMTPSQHDQMFKRLRSRLMEPACPDLPHILDFLVSMARNDARNAVGNRILAVLLDLVLRPDAPREAVQSTAVADVCNAYEDVQHSHMLATIASGQCLERLHQSTGSVNGAHLLYMLLVTESPKKPIETRLMSTLNQGGELIVAVMDSFGAFLDQQRAAAAANPSGEPPPVCSFTHKEAVEVYNRLLLEILPKGSFFVSLGQLGIFLRWATERAPTPEDADVVWNTLTSMVHGRKEVEQPTALEFFQTKLCHVAPEAVTPHAWRCITAFMAALADWNVELTQERGAVDFAATVARSPGETWTLGRALLAAIALRGPSIVAPKAALLLAQLVALSLRKGSSPEEVRSRVREEVAPWRQEVEGAFSQLFVRTPSSWHESVPLREELFTPEVGAALQRADRALMYLDFLIDNGRGGVLPMQFQHEASYRDTDVVLDLRVQPFGPLLAMQQAQKGHGGAAEKPTAHSIPVLLPANAFIGTLRITAAEAVSKVIGMHTSPAHLMLVGMVSAVACTNLQNAEPLTTTLASCCSRCHQNLFTPPFNASSLNLQGKRYTDDAAIVGLPNLGPAVMVAYTEQPNAVSDVPPDARALLEAASPAAALADDSDLYAMVLNLAQLRPHWGDGALVFACRMRANRFLNAMPTCKDAIADAERLLQSEDCSQEVLQLVCLPPAAGAAAAGAAVGGGRAPNDAVLRYFLEVLAALVLPTRNPLKPEAAEDAEEKACFLLSRMFPSRMMPMLYELVQNHPWLGGLVIAPTVHSVLLLISTRIAVEMSRHMQLMKQAHAQQHRVQQIAVGAAARAELQRSRSTTPGADGGEVASALANCALTALQAMLSGNKPSYSSAPGLCQRGLELLDMSIALDAQVIDRLVSSPATHDGHNLFGRVVHCMLACSHEEIRTMASQWLSRFAGQSPAARGWTFTGVVTKLLGLTEPNDQQAEVCSNILSSLAPGEAAIASGLLEQLAPRLLAAIDGGLPLRNIAASMEALVRCLRDRAVNEVRRLGAPCPTKTIGLFTNPCMPKTHFWRTVEWDS